MTDLILELIARRAQFGNGLFREQLLQRPFLDVLVLVVFQLRNELYRSRKDRAFILFAARHNFGQLVYAFVNRFAAAALHWKVLAKVSCGE